MKTSKRIVSFLLSAIMVVTTFLAVGPVFTIEAEAADITLDGITQQRVVGATDNAYKDLYASYQSRFFKGKETNWPTNIVIPGLAQKDDYTPQGMTYWAAKEWILISAYDAKTYPENTPANDKRCSVIYAIDAKTTEFVALFRIYEKNGDKNVSHGGGIAASEYNFYYADSGSNISYWPLAEMDVAENTVKEITIYDSIDCSGELNGAATSYCCYDQGVLWAGNFEWESDDYAYSQNAHPNYQSGLVGYRLKGDSSAEEWANLQDKNIVNSIATLGSNSAAGSGATLNYNFSVDENGYFDIDGSITGFTATTGEITSTFGTVDLVDGVSYILEFDVSTSNLNSIDFYFLRDGSTGSYTNVKFAAGGDMTITDNGNGTTHCELKFTPGEPLKNGAGARSMDGNWDNVANASGNYHLRFDQDNITSNYDFDITNVHIYKDTGFKETTESAQGCAGNPTYCIFFADGIDRIQYAMVDNGRIYMSRSWSRTDSGNHIRELDIADLDINSVGGTTLTVNKRSRDCHIVTMSSLTRFGGAYKDNSTPLDKRNQMLFMGEALCVMDGYLYMFGEGAAWTYNGKEASKCPEPIDVIWKIDQYAIMGEERTTEDVPAIHYQKVNSLAEITDDDEYIIVFESSIKDPVTQKNYLYAIDSYGNYGNTKLPKNDNPTDANTYDAMGIVGYQIDRYTLEEGGKLYLEEEDDANKSIRWKISGANKPGSLRIKNMDPYFSSHRNLLVGSRVFSLASDSATSSLNRMAMDMQNGHFRLFYADQSNTYPIWCNDGTNQGWLDLYSNYYKNHGKIYTPVYNQLDEIVGTFHADAYKYDGNSGNLTGNGDVSLAYQYLDIYKRIPDEFAITDESKVYTDLSAELQADGTYNLTLEAYATASLHYKQLPGNQRRDTDYIFVLDTSDSMKRTGGKGYGVPTDTSEREVTIGELVGKDMVESIGGTGEHCRDRGTDFYLVDAQGNYCQLLVTVKTTQFEKGFLGIGIGSIRQDYWVYYKGSDGLYYLLKDYDNGTNTIDAGVSRTTLESYFSGNSNCTDYSTQKNAGDRENQIMYYQMHYRPNQDISRLTVMQNLVTSLTYRIADDANDNNLDHRIAICNFSGTPGGYGGQDNGGGFTGFFINNSATRQQHVSGFNTQTGYDKVFHSVSQFDNVRTIVSSLSCSGASDASYGMHMASEMIKASNVAGVDYTYSGTRSACVILITDGGVAVVENATTEAGSGALSSSSSAIMAAREAKQRGASVYTLRVGAEDFSDFDEEAYLSYVSMNYVDAINRINVGDRNPHQVEYSQKYTSTMETATTYPNEILDFVERNSKYCLAKLDANSIIFEKLNLEAFEIDANTKITAETKAAHYDGLGRLYFDETGSATTISSEMNLENGSIKVSGFDFSKTYVTPANETNAKKLVVTIAGVLPSEKIMNTEAVDNDFVNVLISDTDSTGVYQSAKTFSENDKHQAFPQDRVIIPQYTYVLDYGKPMFDPDVYGTVESIDSQIRKQTVKSQTYDNEIIHIEPLRDAEGTDDLLYTITPGTKDVQSAYVLIKRPNGTSYDWFRLNIVPASTVQFEETWLKTKDAGTDASKLVDWTFTGTPKYKYQSLSGSNDVYGLDSNFVSFIGDFSDNTYSTVSVTSSNNRSETLTTSFAGTGIDLYSACGQNTGIQVVAIRDSAGNLVKSYVVDTFFKGDTFTQVPIVRFTGAHDVYTIETTAAYLSYAGAIKFGTQSISSEVIDENGHIAYTTEVNETYEEHLLKELGFEELIGSDVELVYFSEDSILNGGEGAFAVEEGAFTTQGVTSLVNYVDGFRTYKPLEADYEEHYIMSEKNAAYYNVLDLLNENSADAGATFVEIIENMAQGSAYNSQNAPKGEFYLQKSTTGLSFQVPNWQPGVTKLMMSARAAKGQPNIKVNNADLGTITTTTDLFYDVSGYVRDDGVVMIVNQTDGAILALNSIKIVDPSGGISPLAFDSMSVINEILAMPEIEGELMVTPTLPEEFTNPGTPPEAPDFPDEPNNPDDGNDDIVPPSDDNNNPEEPAEDGFFAKVESFFVKIFNFFKNIFNKVSTFFKF